MVEDDFDLYLMCNRKPVEALEDSGDMVMGGGVGEQRSGVYLGDWVMCNKNAIAIVHFVMI